MRKGGLKLHNRFLLMRTVNKIFPSRRLINKKYIVFLKFTVFKINPFFRIAQEHEILRKQEEERRQV